MKLTEFKKRNRKELRKRKIREWSRRTGLDISIVIPLTLLLIWIGIVVICVKVDAAFDKPTEDESTMTQLESTPQDLPISDSAVIESTDLPITTQGTTETEKIFVFKEEVIEWVQETDTFHEEYYIDTTIEDGYVFSEMQDMLYQSVITHKFGVLSNEKWTWENQYLLLKLAMREAGAEDIEGIALVINVVFNRIASPKFPDTLEEVIYQPAQFAATKCSNWDTIVPNEKCYKALEMVLEGYDESQGATYFEATSNSANSWHARKLEYLFTHGGHHFYK